MLPYTATDMLNKMRADYGLDVPSTVSVERTVAPRDLTRRERLRRTLISLILPVPLLYLLQPAVPIDHGLKESDDQHVAAPASPR